MNEEEKNITPVIMETAISIPYSPMKMKMKLPLLYSMLKPLTSSLSPSAKSNGARFDSATILILHAMINKIVGVSRRLVK